MGYRITHDDEENHWLFISSDGDDSEPNDFISLVKSIQQAYDGKISCVGDLRYKIEGLPCDMIFQWDDLFGIVIEYTNGNKSEVLSLLKKFAIG